MAPRRWLTTCCFCVCSALLAACNTAESRETTAAAAGDDAAAESVSARRDSGREPLNGGDPLSWPTPAADAADSNFCDVDMRLPLEREPVWEFAYTPAQFSAGDPTQIAHYDGTLAVISACPQILALDTDTGELLFNKDVFSHLDNEQTPEQFTGLFFNPYGLLVGKDNLGRHYCWEVLDGEPRQLWLEFRMTDIGAYVALPEQLITSADGEIRSLAIEAGTEQWKYPNLGSRCGVVVSQSGVVVAWTSVGEFFALDLESGALLWSFISGITGWTAGVRAAIDDSQDCVYLVLADERAQRRKLADGELEWEYSWEEMTSEEERAEMFAGSPYGPFPMYAIAPIITPDGLVLNLISGATIALDHAGRERWTYETNVAIWGAVGFRNAILVDERYIPLGHRQYMAPLVVFCPDEIDWGNYLQADGNRRFTDVFERLVILDYASGERLDVFESARPTSAALPAHDLFIIGETADFNATERFIKGYRWLDWRREGEEK